MKIQCSCGAKYELDIVPGMGRVSFVCQNCGQDYSEYVNGLIRQQLGESAAPPPAQAAPSTLQIQLPQFRQRLPASIVPSALAADHKLNRRHPLPEHLV